jgi:hypothetical protein
LLQTHTETSSKLIFGDKKFAFSFKIAELAGFATRFIRHYENGSNKNKLILFTTIQIGKIDKIVEIFLKVNKWL